MHFSTPNEAEVSEDTPERPDPYIIKRSRGYNIRPKMFNHKTELDIIPPLTATSFNSREINYLQIAINKEC